MVRHMCRLPKWQQRWEYCVSVVRRLCAMHVLVSDQPTSSVSPGHSRQNANTSRRDIALFHPDSNFVDLCESKRVLELLVPPCELQYFRCVFRGWRVRFPCFRELSTICSALVAVAARGSCSNFVCIFVPVPTLSCKFSRPNESGPGVHYR